MDGHPPDQDPKGKSNVQTERRGCKISVSCRARGLWGSVEGCQIRYHHIKTSLRGDTGKEWHGFFRKTKAQIHRHSDTQHAQSYFPYTLQSWKTGTWATLSHSLFFCLSTHKITHILWEMPNGLQTSNFQPTLTTLQSEITLPLPPQ